MMLASEGVKIWRPRQLYVGEEKRDYVPIDQRKEKQGKKKVGTEPSQVEHLFSKRAMLSRAQRDSKL